MNLTEAINKAESLSNINNRHYCIVDSISYQTLSKDYPEESSEDNWDFIETDTIRHFPSTMIFYDTITKSKRYNIRYYIIDFLLKNGFTASPYNNDSSLCKFYSIEGIIGRIRIELWKNGITTIFVVNRDTDTTTTINKFFDPGYIIDLVGSIFTKTEKRNLKINNLLE